MDVLTNDADLSERWVREFLRRLGYMLAAEHAGMPPGDLRDSVGNAAADLIDMVHAVDEDEANTSPALRIVE